MCDILGLRTAPRALLAYHGVNMLYAMPRPHALHVEPTQKKPFLLLPRLDQPPRRPKVNGHTIPQMNPPDSHLAC
eukprot:3948468-Alexandrium_andersonii.AAC.1